MKPKMVFFTESMSVMGGMERVIEFLTSSFAKDFNITILTMDNVLNDDFNINCAIESLNITTIPNNYWNKIKRYISTISRLKKFFKKNQDIDYFIANSPALCCSTMLTKIIFNPTQARLIAFEHNTFNFPGKFWQIVRRYTFKKCHRVIALTNDANREYKKIGCKSVHIPNAVAIGVSNISKLDQKKIIAVGRLVYQKGFDLLLPAWKIVVKTYPNWQLEIVGDGPDKDALNIQMKTLGITDNVLFSGKTNNVQQKYLSASAFVLSSRYEGFGLVLIEAMAHGLPCISFNCPSGPNELISNGINGYLVEEQNINELAKKIQKYIELNDFEKKVLSLKSIEIAQDYTPEKIINKWKSEVFND